MFRSIGLKVNELFVGRECLLKVVEVEEDASLHFIVRESKRIKANSGIIGCEAFLVLLEGAKCEGFAFIEMGVSNCGISLYGGIERNQALFKSFHGN